MKQLSERDFIHEEAGQNPGPMIWFILLVLATGIGYWGIQQWQNRQITTHQEKAPFLQVTNRDFSLFLWQNPQWMRVNQKNKSAYLPAFESKGRGRLTLSQADDWVVVSPAALFHYHQWNRQISTRWFPRTIGVKEFRLFLQDRKEWLPKNWPNAPDAYVQLVKNLPEMANLAPDLPPKVQQAFQGWKNYFLEGKLINKARFRYETLHAFREENSGYEWEKWKNLYSGYVMKPLPSFGAIPPEQLPGFLRLALFNYQRATGKSTTLKPSS